MDKTGLENCVHLGTLLNVGWFKGKSQLSDNQYLLLGEEKISGKREIFTLQNRIIGNERFCPSWSFDRFRPTQTSSHTDFVPHRFRPTQISSHSDFVPFFFN